MGAAKELTPEEEETGEPRLRTELCLPLSPSSPQIRKY